MENHTNYYQTNNKHKYIYILSIYQYGLDLQAVLANGINKNNKSLN